MRDPRAVLAGVRAALESPRWIGGPRLSELLREPARVAGGGRVPRGAIGGAFLVLRVLGKLPGGHWRNTCLYRSVAECLVLRRYGIAATLRIGVRSAEGIEAHAWVVRPDRPVPGHAHGHEPLVMRA